MNDLSTMIPLLLVVLVWLAAVYDLRNRRIPNWLTLGVAVGGVVVQTCFAGVSGAGAALSGWAVGLFILMPGFLLRATGPGDVKLLAAVGTLLGPYWVLLAGLVGIAFGAVIAVAVAAHQCVFEMAPGPFQRYGTMLRILVATRRVAYIAPAPHEAMGTKFPFAVAIALGVTATMPWSFPQLLMILNGVGG